MRIRIGSRLITTNPEAKLATLLVLGFGGLHVTNSLANGDKGEAILQTAETIVTATGAYIVVSKVVRVASSRTATWRIQPAPGRARP
jgi:hypothetical protein